MADGLLWIGHSYNPFYCGATGPCASSRCCFVHEAEWRGISRKLRAIPKWQEEGKHRIFLTHRGGHTTTDLGTIYGYFDPYRIEIIGGGDGRRAGAPESRPKSDLIEDVIDSIIERLSGLTDQQERTYAPLDAEQLADPRRCRSKRKDKLNGEEKGTGWRESPGAVYVVDELCAEITDAWAELVRRRGLKLAKPWSPAPEFELLVSRLHRTRRLEPLATIPGQLEGLATRRGGLVLFNAPPTWEAFPVASSQSLIQVDGDDLLDQIERGRPKAKVTRLSDPKAHEDLALELTRACGVNLHLAEAFLAARRTASGDEDVDLEALAHGLEHNGGAPAQRHDELVAKCACMLERAALAS